MEYIFIHCTFAIFLIIVVLLNVKKITGQSIIWLIIGILLGMGLHKLILLLNHTDYIISK